MHHGSGVPVEDICENASTVLVRFFQSTNEIVHVGNFVTCSTPPQVSAICSMYRILV